MLSTFRKRLLSNPTRSSDRTVCLASGYFTLMVKQRFCYSSLETFLEKDSYFVLAHQVTGLYHWFWFVDMGQMEEGLRSRY